MNFQLLRLFCAPRYEFEWRHREEQLKHEHVKDMIKRDEETEKMREKEWRKREEELRKSFKEEMYKQHVKDERKAQEEMERIWADREVKFKKEQEEKYVHSRKGLIAHEQYEAKLREGEVEEK